MYADGKHADRLVDQSIEQCHCSKNLIQLTNEIIKGSKAATRAVSNCFSGRPKESAKGA